MALLEKRPPKYPTSGKDLLVAFLFRNNVLSLPRYESIFSRNRRYFVCAGSGGYLCADVAYNAVFVALGSGVGEGFASALRVVAPTQGFWRVYPQLPRASRHTFAREDNIGGARVAHDRVLHSPRGERVVVGAAADGAPRRSDFVAYTFVQDTKKELRKNLSSFLVKTLVSRLSSLVSNLSSKSWSPPVRRRCRDRPCEQFLGRGHTPRNAPRRMPYGP